jgi:hypothetical protein
LSTSDAEDTYGGHPVVSLCAISLAILGDLVTQAALDAAVEQLGATSRSDTAALEAEALAVAGLRDAVRVEDTLEYDEPPTQFFPTRHFLGAALLRSAAAAAAVAASAAGSSSDGAGGQERRPAAVAVGDYVQEAVGVYEQALKDYPGNGWALHGTAHYPALSARAPLLLLWSHVIPF